MAAIETTSSLEILAGTPEGGGQDRAARALAQALANVVDRPVLVTNLPGRGGGNAWDELMRRRGEPDVVAISSPTLVTNRLTGVASLAPADVTQLAILCTESIVFAVPAASQLQTPDRLLEAIGAATPPVMALATARGNVNHIAMALLAREAGQDPAAVAVRVFDSARYAIADVVGGHADCVAVSAASLLPELRAGQLLAVASTADERLPPPLDQILTWAEAGARCTIGTWRGVVAPPGLSGGAMRRWNDLLARAVQSDDWRGAIRRHLWSDTWRPAEAINDFVAEEERRMAAALADLRLIPDNG